ncbi:hypothetical protein ACFL96_17025 [Thermoproteota archaeon]
MKRLFLLIIISLLFSGVGFAQDKDAPVSVGQDDSGGLTVKEEGLLSALLEKFPHVKRLLNQNKDNYRKKLYNVIKANPGRIHNALEKGGNADSLFGEGVEKESKENAGRKVYRRRGDKDSKRLLNALLKKYPHLREKYSPKELLDIVVRSPRRVRLALKAEDSRSLEAVMDTRARKTESSEEKEPKESKKSRGDIYL